MSHLSRVSGVPKATLSDWIKGTSPRNLVQLKKVASAFKTSIDELCFGSGKEVRILNESEIILSNYEIILKKKPKQKGETNEI